MRLLTANKVFLACVSLAILALLLTPALTHLDHQLIRAQRLINKLQWQMGYALPGAPDYSALNARLAQHGLKLGAPVFVRIFKRDFELELWMKRDGRFHLFQTYPICKWSGRLGPKLREGDHQSPEGFYTVTNGAMNPDSRWHRSFNLGFPNTYDRQHGRTGSFLMVHGGCSSVGCYAVTNAAIDEIWTITKAAFRGGQKRFHVHAYPFRMTASNIAAAPRSGWSSFWQDLKQGSDAFEHTWLPPRIYNCRGQYVVTAVDDDASRGAHRIRRHCPPPERRFAASPAG
ncbi:MAG: L,D-transpeptidase family protein [Hyphomicrobiaceae bacterium]